MPKLVVDMLSSQEGDVAFLLMEMENGGSLQYWLVIIHFHDYGRQSTLQGSNPYLWGKRIKAIFKSAFVDLCS